MKSSNIVEDSGVMKKSSREGGAAAFVIVSVCWDGRVSHLEPQDSPRSHWCATPKSSPAGEIYRRCLGRAGNDADKQ